MKRRTLLLFAFLAFALGAAAWRWLWPIAEPVPSMRILERVGGTIHVVPVQPVSEQSLRAFAESLAPMLPIPVTIRRDWQLDERRLLSWSGYLYDVDHLLNKLRETVPRGLHVIGVTDQPMHDQEHWWLFGKAGDVCIVSIAHLWRDEWSEERDWSDPLLRSRTAKVGVHEFGHHVGFDHCDDSRCVMYFASELWMLDATPTDICSQCLRNWLHWN